jgi:deoxyadenosine/deoxycytidine kinase
MSKSTHDVLRGQGMQICMAGTMGSGKTTLAQIVSDALGFRYIPEPIPPSYLIDLFSDPQRWAFEVQTAFLIRKGRLLCDARNERVPVILDRSLYEDVEIFARLFHEIGAVDDRAYSTYLEVARFTLAVTPPPTAIIFCECDAAECERRVEQRGLRPFETLFPEGHFERVEQLYLKWLYRLDHTPVYIANTQRHDFRASPQREAFIRDIHAIVTSPEAAVVRTLKMAGN